MIDMVRSVWRHGGWHGDDGESLSLCGLRRLPPFFPDGFLSCVSVVHMGGRKLRWWGGVKRMYSAQMAEQVEHQHFTAEPRS